MRNFLDVSRNAFLFFSFFPLFPILKGFFQSPLCWFGYGREGRSCNSGFAAEGHKAEQLPLAGGIPGLIPSHGTGKRDIETQRRVG